jgi:hypothetical protein
LVITIIVVGLFLTIKHFRINQLIVNELKEELGLNVSIESITFSPLLAHIEARGITIYNPPEFKEKELAYISSIDFVFDPLEIIFHIKPQIYLFAIDLERLNIIKNIEGKVNLKEIAPIKHQESTDDQYPFSFGVMVLSVKEVNYNEYSAQGKKTSKYMINMKNQTFVQVIDEDQLIRLIVSKAIENTDIGKLIHLKVTPVLSDLHNTVDSALGTAHQGFKSAFEIITLPFRVVFK